MIDIHNHLGEVPKTHHNCTHKGNLKLASWPVHHALLSLVRSTMRLVLCELPTEIMSLLFSQRLAVWSLYTTRHNLQRRSTRLGPQQQLSALTTL